MCHIFSNVLLCPKIWAIIIRSSGGAQPNSFILNDEPFSFFYSVEHFVYYYYVLLLFAPMIMTP